MLNNQTVSDLILKMDAFMVKEGHDLTIRNDVIKLINDLFNAGDALDAIYVNNTDNFNIPDVVVLPSYHKDFNLFLMDGDVTATCPFGYTVEIHHRCFKSYTAEELTAVIIHDILQNIMSCTAKTRFLKAYNFTLSKYKNDDILDLFDEISNSEVTYMSFVDICTRPFRVPVMQYDYIGTDDVLKNLGLGDAYDTYLDKIYDSSQHWVNPDSKNDTPEKRIEQNTKDDFRTMKTIFAACMDKDIRHYYAMVRNGVPLVTLDHVFGKPSTVASLGFISTNRHVKNYIPAEPVSTVITESFINPKTEVELRFQVDKIISEMRYAESEAEREVILFKIKNLSLKLLKTVEKLKKDQEKRPQDKNIRDRMEFVQNIIDELDALRDKTVKMDIKEKCYGVFVKVPKRYADPGPMYDPGWY